MTRNIETDSKLTGPLRESPPNLAHEVDRLNRELRAFVAVALQHGLRDYCVTRHPAITAHLERFHKNSRLRAQQKYERVLTRIGTTPRLHGTAGDTAKRTYYRNAKDNVAYIEHALKDSRFLLGGIWVAPPYRGKGYAHELLRVLVRATDEVDLGIELYHEPFGEEGLNAQELEAFYNRHGFTKHQSAPGGLVRFPSSPLDVYKRR